jgi:peptidoglycan/xylan/chitin deacetylase (PgdA/CDA1 family)
MEESKRQIKPSSIVFLIIYIVIILILSYFTIINFYKIKEETKKEESIKNELVKVKSEYDSLMTTQESLVSEITNLKNIDENTESIKNEVFILAQQVEEKIQNKETDYKIAYLTFDDGPYYLTDSVIKTLKENKVKATFFTIGQGKETCFDNRSASCLDTYKKIVDNGHTIANHTYSHAIFYGLYNSTDSFMKEVEKQEELIYSKTGVKTNILRFPGGSATAGTLKNGIISKLREKGYGWVDWSAQDGDGGNLTSASQAWSNFTGSINDNIEVVLFHDYNQITYSILPDVIKYLEERDYILLPLFYDSVMINK